MLDNKKKKNKKFLLKMSKSFSSIDLFNKYENDEISYTDKPVKREFYDKYLKFKENKL